MKFEEWLKSEYDDDVLATYPILQAEKLMWIRGRFSLIDEIEKEVADLPVYVISESSYRGRTVGAIDSRRVLAILRKNREEIQK